MFNSLFLKVSLITKLRFKEIGFRSFLNYQKTSLEGRSFKIINFERTSNSLWFLRC